MRVCLALVVAFLSLSSSANSADLDALFEQFGVQKLSQEIGIPELTLIDLEGKEHPFSAYKNKALLITFWATWCGVCRQELPQLSSYYEGNKSDDFAVLAVSNEDELDLIRSYAQPQQFSFNVLQDPRSALWSLFSISAIPTSVLVGADGFVKGIFQGARDFASPTFRAIRAALAASAAPVLPKDYLAVDLSIPRLPSAVVGERFVLALEVVIKGDIERASIKNPALRLPRGLRQLAFETVPYVYKAGSDVEKKVIFSYLLEAVELGVHHISDIRIPYSDLKKPGQQFELTRASIPIKVSRSILPLGLAAGGITFGAFLVWRSLRGRRKHTARDIQSEIAVASSATKPLLQRLEQLKYERFSQQTRTWLLALRNSVEECEENSDENGKELLLADIDQALYGNAAISEDSKDELLHRAELLRKNSSF